MSFDNPESTFKRDNYRNALIIPITFGRNRIRGQAAGALIQDDGSSTGPLAKLRDCIRRETVAAGHEPTDEGLTRDVARLLRLYEDSHRRYVEERNAEIGHVWEGNWPSGQVVLMAESATLRRLGLAA